MQVLYIALAGAAGTVLRYGVALGCARLTRLAIGTLVVNVVACFVLALVTQACVRGSAIAPDVKLAITVGFCGGLSTYSTWNDETLTLLRAGHVGSAIGSVVLTLVLCAVAALFGGLCATAWVRSV